MSSFEYSNTFMEQVVFHEDKIYIKYLNLINEFQKSFAKYGCEIQLEKCWTIDGVDKAFTTRPTGGNNYIFWICYQILFNKKPVVYDDENSILSRSYGVLSVKTKKHLFKDSEIIIRPCYELDDVIEELTHDLNTVKTMAFNMQITVWDNEYTDNTGDSSLS